MAIAAAGALVLSACTSDTGTDDPTTDEAGEDAGTDDAPPGDEPTDDDMTEGPTEGDGEMPLGETAKEDLGEVTAAEGNISYSVGADEWQGFNSDLSSTNSVYNAVVNARLSHGFWYWGTDGTVYPNPDFGTYQMTSEDPLTVEYTISEAATWSDGTPITFNDFLLGWASSNPEVLFGEPEVDADGNAILTFDSVSSDFGTYVPDGPTGEVDGKTFTLTYPEPYPDWEIMIGSAYPAHVVERESGMQPGELAEAILAQDGATVEMAAEFWNEGWLSREPGTLPDPALVPSSGPYSLDPAHGAEWSAGQYITVGANPEFYGTPPATSNLTFRFAAPETHVTALQNGDINVIEPQATIDTVQQIDALGDSVTKETANELTFEHLDYNFAESSPFSEANGGLAAREAFAYCVPRQEIVDRLIVPINPDAVVMNSREIFPFQDGYEEHVAAMYDGRYDTVDLEMATTKFEESGLEEGTEIRIGYGAGNQRRTEEVALIKSSCDQVGFEIVDAAGPSLGDVLTAGDWEIAMFGWAGSGTVTGSAFWYEIDGQGNYGGWVNEEADTAWATISTTLDEAAQAEQLAIIEAAAWNDLHSIPLFAFPGVIAYDSRLENVRFNATQTQVAWNAEQWRFAQ